MKKEVVVTVEMTKNAYCASLEKLPGCVAIGTSFDEVEKNIAEAVKAYLEKCRKDGTVPKRFPDEYELVFRFDPESLLRYYLGVFTLPTMERYTGISQEQLQQYAHGQSRPGKVHCRKIVKGLHKLGNHFLEVEL
ncbi:hypothetical protein Barb7_01098 [Bacteroidales bacterium Barb7]|nr:hypothetical protein Barb7_01098 [Bacteroidales bacterium Barb7]